MLLASMPTLTDSLISTNLDLPTVLASDSSTYSTGAYGEISLIFHLKEILKQSSYSDEITRGRAVHVFIYYYTNISRDLWYIVVHSYQFSYNIRHDEAS